MKILFLTILHITDITKHGLYEDFISEFVNNGHDVTIVSPYEKNLGKQTELIQKDGYKLLKVQTGDIQKTSFIKKGISTVLLPYQYKKAIKKYLDMCDYDLIICSTPPITLVSVIDYIKNNSKAKFLLLLKDIWPQSMVDMDAINENGLIYKYFRNKEKNIYRLSDWIACTSQANIDFVKKHNDVDDNKLILITNGLSKEVPQSNGDRAVLDRLNIPSEKLVFFYGGNLGIPQDIAFLKECIMKCRSNTKVHFVVCGKGVQRKILEDYVSECLPENLTLLEYLPQSEYTEMVSAVDVCMVFLNHKFKVPNCPARFYAYMQSGKPILASTDKATDIRLDIENGNFGWWCESVDSDLFEELVNKACESDLEELGNNARIWFDKYYTTQISYDTVVNIMKKD